ncbi:MAG: 5-formyltetrahydrofolate cyclo-ligase [Micromonosporaceae bacterium]|nr:5-formyltetrahydrofolate cyclo-ligase [Micromonosporaceae bacterium]
MPDFSALCPLLSEGEVRLIAAPGPDKPTSRAAVLARRRSLPPPVRAAADEAIRRVLTSVVAAIAPATVCAHAPMSGEPGGPDLPRSLAAVAGIRLLLPVLRTDNDLDWARYPADLAPGRYGLLEPTGPRLGVAAVAHADLVVAPGLAMAADGVRLGRGGGSYDRSLTRVPASALVLVALYDGEVFATLPHQPHDQFADAAATPSGLHRAASTGRKRPA